MTESLFDFVQHSRSAAVISADLVYRYELTRTWAAGERIALFIMINPSTADASEDDATIRRCRSFAQRENCAGIRVVNLYAFRATKPSALWAANRAGVDIIGPENDTYIGEALEEAERTRSPVIAAWGANAKDAGRTSQVTRLAGMRNAHALGFTTDGQPRHPLMLRADTPLEQLASRGITS